jgi:hypothetical protein
MQMKLFGRMDKVKVFILCAVSMSVLFAGFAFNTWRVAEEKSFDRFQRDTESLILGRLAKSRQEGIFSAGGLTGADIDHSMHDTWITPKETDRQYLAYFDDLPLKRYSPYLSQIGGQGMLYSVLDKLIRIPSTRVKYEIFQVIASGLSALMLTLVVVWFYFEFGLASALFVLASTALSQWLTLFGRNLWWGLWAFYLPMLAVMFFLMLNRTPSNRHFTNLGIIAGAAVFAKCFFNGYEYITTTLVMMTVPFVYYSLLDRANYKHFFKGAVVIVTGSVIAVSVSVIILVMQIGFAEGNTLGGVKHLTSTFEKRTYGDTGDYNSEFSASLEAGTFGVVRNYMDGSYLDLRPNADASDSADAGPVIKVSYSHLIVSFVVVSLLVMLAWKMNPPAGQRDKVPALIITTWFSILAPLSWFIIFKSHSYIHTHINFVVWQMPFTLFGFAAWGAAIQRALSALTRKAG